MGLFRPRRPRPFRLEYRFAKERRMLFPRGEQRADVGRASRVSALLLILVLLALVYLFLIH